MLRHVYMCDMYAPHIKLIAYVLIDRLVTLPHSEKLRFVVMIMLVRSYRFEIKLKSNAPPS